MAWTCSALRAFSGGLAHGRTTTLPNTSRSSSRRNASFTSSSGSSRSMTGVELPLLDQREQRVEVLAHPAVRAEDLELEGPDEAQVLLRIEAGGGAAGQHLAPAMQDA